MCEKTIKYGNTVKLQIVDKKITDSPFVAKPTWKNVNVITVIVTRSIKIKENSESSLPISLKRFGKFITIFEFDFDKILQVRMNNHTPE